jgi:hypothetical protein
MVKDTECTVYGVLTGIAAAFGVIIIALNPVGWGIIAGTALISGGFGGINIMIRKKRNSMLVSILVILGLMEQ